MKLIKPSDVLKLKQGDKITKQNLNDLIQYSKVKSSKYWQGEEYLISNTPQQGINWMGKLPFLKCLILKNYEGAYDVDGWDKSEENIFNYSFKARKKQISLKEKANLVLLKQPVYSYPIYLFTERGSNWHCEGEFYVSGVNEDHVTLKMGASEYSYKVEEPHEIYYEGGIKYVTHIMAERSLKVVSDLKRQEKLICNICNMDFSEVYGVEYIEAHHKVPLSEFSEAHEVKISDFALLCANCHKAVHIYMKNEHLGYEKIKSIIQNHISIT